MLSFFFLTKGVRISVRVFFNIEGVRISVRCSLTFGEVFCSGGQEEWGQKSRLRLS